MQRQHHGRQYEPPPPARGNQRYSNQQESHHQDRDRRENRGPGNQGPDNRGNDRQGNRNDAYDLRRSGRGASDGPWEGDLEAGYRGGDPIREDYYTEQGSADWASDYNGDRFGEARDFEGGRGYPRWGGRFENDRWNARSDSPQSRGYAAQQPYRTESQNESQRYSVGGWRYGQGNYGDSGSYGEYRGGEQRGGPGNSSRYESVNSVLSNQPGELRGGRGEHAGRGPKGYTRSDERIHEDLCESLTEHSEIDASDIEIRVAKGEVILSGTVDDRRTKRLAEDIAESISGVKDVTNQIRVSQANGNAEGKANGSAGNRKSH